MSLDVYLTEYVPTEVFSSNITHNMVPMAEAAGIYEILWRPDEAGVKYAHELVLPLRKGLSILKRSPKRFERMNPANGWGSYTSFVRWLEEYIRACEEHPLSTVSVWG
jgi:hypothetical protein